MSNILPTGQVSMITLLQNSSTSTTWYIPMFNYVGSIYVSQINSGGALLGSFVWSNISADSFSPNYTSSSLSGGMTVGYNQVGANWGLLFTSVDLTSYSLCVMYVGIILGSLAFQNTNPGPTYTITSGTTPTIKTDYSTYTSLEFYGDATLTFTQNVTLADLGTSINGYTSYMLSGTINNPTVNQGFGATCNALPANSSFTINASSSVQITVAQTGTTQQFSSIAVDGVPLTNFSTVYYGGSTNSTFAGGGSAGPGGAGNAPIGTVGGTPNSNVSYNNIGQSGQNDVSSGNYGSGGGGSATSATTGVGASGAVVLTLPGYWSIIN